MLEELLSEDAVSNRYVVGACYKFAIFTPSFNHFQESWECFLTPVFRLLFFGFLRSKNSLSVDRELVCPCINNGINFPASHGVVWVISMFDSLRSQESKGLSVKLAVLFNLGQSHELQLARLFHFLVLVPSNPVILIIYFGVGEQPSQWLSSSVQWEIRQLYWHFYWC